MKRRSGLKKKFSILLMVLLTLIGIVITALNHYAMQDKKLRLSREKIRRTKIVLNSFAAVARDAITTYDDTWWS